MKIHKVRDEIDIIDRQIAELVVRRMRLSIEIGNIKAANGLPVCDKAREAFVMNNADLSGRNPEEIRSIRSVFRIILQNSRKIQTGSNMATKRSAGVTQ